MPNTPTSPVSPLILHARRLGPAWPAETGSINPDGMTACLTFAGSATSGILLKMSNCYCHPGRAGGTPDGISMVANCHLKTIHRLRDTTEIHIHYADYKDGV